MTTRRPIALMVVLTIVVLAACTGSKAKPAEPAQWGALPKNQAATFEYIVPAGTQDRIDRGEKVELMPASLNVKVGDSIRISNQDTHDFFIGPFFVVAGQEVAMRFTHQGVLSGACSLNPAAKFLINVAAA